MSEDKLPTKNEFEFMLSQLHWASELVENRRKRGELGIALSITIITALLAAVMSIVTKNDFNLENISWVIGVAILVGALTFTVAFGAFVSAIKASSMSRGRYLAIREYFFSKYPNTKIYIDDREKTDLLKSWKNGFSKGVMTFIHFVALLISIMVTFGIGFLTFNILLIEAVIIISITFGLINLFLLEFFVFQYRKRVESYFTDRLTPLIENKQIQQGDVESLQE